MLNSSSENHVNKETIKDILKKARLKSSPRSSAKMSVVIVKRLMDIAISIACITLAAPLIVSIALLIKITSKGPVFYVQKRAGMIRNPNTNKASEFNVFKFRTMVNDAEKLTGAVLADDRDPRITWIGRFLRSTRLDELPQFINVLKGEMSVIGPRPERPELLEVLCLAIPFFEERMRFVKPGITGLAQVKLSYTGALNDKSELFRLKDSLVNPFDMEELEGALADDMRIKLLYDLAYTVALERFGSFLKTDISIIFRTPIVMFFSRTGR